MLQVSSFQCSRCSNRFSSQFLASYKSLHQKQGKWAYEARYRQSNQMKGTETEQCTYRNFFGNIKFGRRGVWFHLYIDEYNIFRTVKLSGLHILQNRFVLWNHFPLTDQLPFMVWTWYFEEIDNPTASLKRVWWFELGPLASAWMGKSWCQRHGKGRRNAYSRT